MISPFSNIYEELLTYIGQAVPAIAYIDMDYGQLETHERPSVAFPCLLIDFQGFQYQELGSLCQTATGTIVFKLVTDPYSSTASITPDTYRTAAHYILELEQTLYLALQGYTPVIARDTGGTATHQATPLIRMAINTDNRRPGIKVRELHFSTGFTDQTARRPTFTAPRPDPTITATLEIPTT